MVLTGHGSYLSICSKSAVDWVCQKTGSQSFAATAQKLVYDVCRMLKLDSFDFLSSVPAPEPEPEAAWAYVDAYFTDTVEGLHALIHRPQFEARLKAHFNQPVPPPPGQDPAWYALRNVIYAFGWRSLSRHTRTSGFRYDDGEGWKYFSNALSVQSQLVYCRTGLMGVQALVTMVRTLPRLLKCVYYLLMTSLEHVRGRHRHSFAGVHVVIEQCEASRVQRSTSRACSIMESG